MGWLEFLPLYPLLCHKDQVSLTQVIAHRGLWLNSKWAWMRTLAWQTIFFRITTKLIPHRLLMKLVKEGIHKTCPE